MPGSSSGFRPPAEEHRTRVRAEDEAADRARHVQGLLPEPVTRQQKPCAPHVPDREGEHPVQARRQVDPPLLVAVDEDLRVGPRREAMPALLELAAQLEVVPDLAVEYRHDRAVFVRHRLGAAGQVDDAEPGVAEHAIAPRRGSRVPSGPAVAERYDRLRDPIAICRLERHPARTIPTMPHIRLPPPGDRESSPRQEWSWRSLRSRRGWRPRGARGSSSGTARSRPRLTTVAKINLATLSTPTKTGRSLLPRVAPENRPSSSRLVAPGVEATASAPKPRGKPEHIRARHEIPHEGSLEVPAARDAVQHDQELRALEQGDTSRVSRARGCSLVPVMGPARVFEVRHRAAAASSTAE